MSVDGRIQALQQTYQSSDAYPAVTPPVSPGQPDPAASENCCPAGKPDLRRASQPDGDIRKTIVTRTRACVDRAKSAEGRCGAASPSGQPCIAEVERYDMNHRGVRSHEGD